MDRVELGELWLRWYIQRADREKPITNIEAEYAEARQLQVMDVEGPEVWRALATPDPAEPAHNHVARIEYYEDRYRGTDQAVLVLPAWHTDQGPVIIDGAHRACALWRLDPRDLDADVVLCPAPSGHPDLGPDPRVSS